MCKSSCKSNMRFSTESLMIDLSKNMDDVICDFLKVEQEEGFETCANCEREDIFNEYNFKQICCSCEKRICLDCYNICLNENDGFMLDEVSINNFNNCDEDEWICGDCGHCCEKCEEYFDEWSIVGLLDIEGEWIYSCRGCVNSCGLDLVRNQERDNINRCSITYTREPLVRSMGDYVNCEDCCNKNYDWEYNKDLDEMSREELKVVWEKYNIEGIEDDDEEFKDIETDEIIDFIKDFLNDYEDEYKEDNEDDFYKDENDLDFFKFYDERECEVMFVCEECVNLNLRY